MPNRIRTRSPAIRGRRWSAKSSCCRRRNIEKRGRDTVTNPARVPRKSCRPASYTWRSSGFHREARPGYYVPSSTRRPRPSTRRLRATQSIISWRSWKTTWRVCLRRRTGANARHQHARLIITNAQRKVLGNVGGGPQDDPTPLTLCTIPRPLQLQTFFRMRLRLQKFSEYSEREINRSPQLSPKDMQFFCEKIGPDRNRTARWKR